MEEKPADIYATSHHWRRGEGSASFGSFKSQPEISRQPMPGSGAAEVAAAPLRPTIGPKYLGGGGL